MSGLRLFCRKRTTFKVYCGEDFYSFKSDLPSTFKTIFEKIRSDETVSVNSLESRGGVKKDVPQICICKTLSFR